LDAVRLVRERDVSVAEVAHDLVVHENVLRKSWIKQFDDDPRQAFPSHGVMKQEQAEIERLRCEVQKLQAECDILKTPRPTSPRIKRDV
jgi:transposase